MNPEVTYDEKSLLINGERLFLYSAAIHYFRMPKGEWRDILLKAKMAGCNCIDTYLAWNFHETEEGIWDFEGDKDFGEFLEYCRELGLMSIVRPGPYICSEWDFGGLPWWLNNKGVKKVRSNDPVYLHYVDLYFDKVVPIIEKHQFTNGGSVILVQVENEYGYFADDDEAEPYMRYLKDGLIKRGINVPLITCVGGLEGTIECANFWSGAQQHYQTLREKQPDTPKLVTEFWSGWFENWGGAKSSQKDAQTLELRLMETIKAGFSGINYYMFYGGTNFGSWGGRTVGASNIFMIQSYDFDSPIGEYGELTPKYDVAKRYGYFFQNHKEFLLHSKPIHDAIKHPENCSVEVREWENQKLLFVLNQKEERTTFPISMPDGRTFKTTVEPHRIQPLFLDYKLNEEISINYNSFFLHFNLSEEEDVCILFAKNGQRSLLELKTEEELIFKPNTCLIYGKTDSTLWMDFYHFEDIQTFAVLYGNKKLKIIVLNEDVMNKTWIYELEKQTYIHINSEFPNVKKKFDRGVVHINRETPITGRRVAFTDWEFDEEQLDITFVPASDKPMDFSSMGRRDGYLLYTTEFHHPQDETTAIILPGIQDPARVFVNGKEIGLVKEVFSSSINIPLVCGINKIQFLTQHMGRYNFSHFMGERKGVFESPYLYGKAQDIRDGWEDKENNKVNLSEYLEGNHEVILSRTFDSTNYDRVLMNGAIGTNLEVNGVQIPISDYSVWQNFNQIDLTPYLSEGVNRLSMTFSNFPIDCLQLLMFHSTHQINGWMQMEAASIQNPKVWKKYKGKQLGNPAWYKTEFAIEKAHLNAIKLRMTGMGKGLIWINGFNIGRYWQIGPQEDYKIPFSLLKSEGNELIIFDEEGRCPSNVSLIIR